jgi:hypothetical protein
MTGARNSNLYVAIDLFVVSALTIHSRDMWNNQCHAGDLRNWEPMDWVVIVSFQVCHPQIPSSSPRASLSKTRKPTTRAAEIPYPQTCTPSPPLSKTARFHSRSDHRNFSSWDPRPHRGRSWGWSVDRPQESWDVVREVLELIWVGHSDGR